MVRVHYQKKLWAVSVRLCAASSEGLVWLFRYMNLSVLLFLVMDMLPVSCLWLRKRHIWGKVKMAVSPRANYRSLILVLNPILGLQLPALDL